MGSFGEASCHGDYASFRGSFRSIHSSILVGRLTAEFVDRKMLSMLAMRKLKSQVLTFLSRRERGGYCFARSLEDGIPKVKHRFFFPHDKITQPFILSSSVAIDDSEFSWW